MKKHILFSVFFVLTAIASNSHAQHSGWDAVYNRSNSGLPFDDIDALAIEGSNIWIGTDGLARFDGTNWTVYNHSNSGLPDYTISAIVIEGSNIWIGTWGGLVRFDGTNWTVYNTSNSALPNNVVNAIAVEESNIWVGTDDGSHAELANAKYGDIAKYDGTKWTAYEPNKSLTDYNVHALAIEGSNIWIGTRGDLVKYDGADWTVYNRYNSGLPNNEEQDNVPVNAIAIEGSNIWVGTSYDGLVKFDGH